MTSRKRAKHLHFMLSLTAYGFAAFLLQDATWQQLSAVACLILGAWSAEKGSKL